MPFIEYKWKKNIGPILTLNIKGKAYGICLCHKIKERSLSFLGLEKFFCSRCLGILSGSVLAILLHFLRYNLSLGIAGIFTIPMLVDGFSQYLGFRRSNNILRLITGILFGISFNYFGGMF
ncbi:MAG TPA: DUF2085 domain-containing protein [Candidatus Nanoarchaeia archaeon]|nr:DUF2085 domain-containing protein [Candidatus Nanoarchaeia archaeon]